MPAKLKFRVVQCSSEDPEFPSTELNAHSPHTVGWQSARFCDFPQEIGFQFAGPVHLVQLQVLSHQYKIASKLELFVGTCPDGDKISYQKCKWKRLGYLSLDNNERSSWQARELKSVQLDAYGRFLKIVAHSCHTNKLNMYSQIGLIAINLIGDAVSSGAPAPQGAPAGKETPGTRKEISALDDLTFDLNFDPATAAQIRELHVAKERAVRAEDYDAAKRLKEAMERLKQVGARMAKLELRKKAAVDNEDYDTAKLIKAEMDKLRAGLSYASDHHAGDPRSVAGGSGAMAGAGGHRPANVVVEEEDVRPGGGGGGGSPYVKNPFGNKAGFAGGGPGGAGGSGHSPSHHSPPPAHNQAYSPEGGEGRGGYDDGYQTPARGGMAVGGQASMPSPSQSGLPDDKAAGHLGVQGGGAVSHGMSNSPYNMAQGSPAVGGGLYGGGASGGGANVEEAARDRETGMAQGPRRILDPDARQVRAGPPNPAAESTDLTNDKAALAAAQSEGGPGPPEELTGAAIAEAEPIAEMYGMDVAKMVLSKYWQHRVEGLEEIQKQLVGGGNGARPARVVAAVLKRAIADKNPTVVLSSFQLLNAMLNLTDESGKKLELKGLLDTTLQGAVLKLAEANVRVRDESAKALMALAAHQGAGCAWVAAAVLKPPKQQQNFKAIQSRLEFLRELIDAYPPSSQHGLGMEQTMPMVVLGANSSNAATRTEAIKVWVKLFQTYDRRKIDLHIRSVDSKKTQDLIRAELAGDGVVGDLPAAAAPMPARAKAPAAAKKTPASSAAAKGKPSPAAHKSAQKPGGMDVGDQEPADEVERVQWYLTKAKGGDADAQYNLAICYDEGKGTDKNEKEAARWYAAAAEQGDADAQFSLGVCYHEGKGVDKDDEKAVELWTKSAKQDNQDAKFILGWAEDTGGGEDA